MSFVEEYVQLLHLTRRYLLQEYQLQDWLHCPQLRQTLPESFHTHSNSVQVRPKPKPSLPPTPPLIKTLPPQTTIVSLTKDPKPLENSSLKSAKAAKLDPPKSNSHHSHEPTTSISSSSMDFSDFWKILSERFPQQRLIKEIPAPRLLQRRVIVLSAEVDPEACALLQKMTSAITTHLVPAELVMADFVEQNTGWEALLNASGLQLIIASESLIQTFPQLRVHHRQSAGQSFLGHVPFFPLLDLARYSQEPQLKNALWAGLRKALK